MVVVDMTPVVINLKRKRGDTFPLVFTFTDKNGVAINITGYTIVLTVDPSPDPVDATQNKFALTLSVIDGPNGKAQAGPLTNLQADLTPATYYYDVQWTDGASVRRTVVQGEWAVDQDVTKAGG